MAQFITVIRGEDIELEQIVNVEDVADPITGASCWFTVKRDWRDPDSAALIYKSVEDGTVLGDPARSRFMFRVSHDDYGKFTDDDVGVAYPFWVKYQAAENDGQVTTLRRGRFRIKPQGVQAIRESN